MVLGQSFSTEPPRASTARKPLRTCTQRPKCAGLPLSGGAAELFLGTHRHGCGQGAPHGLPAAAQAPWQAGNAAAHEGLLFQQQQGLTSKQAGLQKPRLDGELCRSLGPALQG
jgi:hypothetical protein